MKVMLSKYWLIACCLFATGLYNGAVYAALPQAQLSALSGDDLEIKISAVREMVMAQTDLPLLSRVLSAWNQDSLFSCKTGLVFSENDVFFRADTGASLSAMPDDAESVIANNRMRSELDIALALINLASQETAVRLKAAQTLQTALPVETLPFLRTALEKESSGAVRSALELALAQASLTSEVAADRLMGIDLLAKNPNAQVRSLLSEFLESSEPDAAVKQAAIRALQQVNLALDRALWVERLFTGFSLGSILLLATLGLAITYGVMGVINMAHGEFLMVGAYATYGVQSVCRQYFPQWIDSYLLVSIPVAFFMAALTGMLLERLIIRHLYGRPLETLLATWGISLAMIQAMRWLCGPQNVEVSNPTWMSGGVELFAGVVLPSNRLMIVAFSFLVLALVWAVMNLTRLGMFVRAVTQNRAMASCVGVNTQRVDTLAFGLGAGIAGLGGVALSQISNVGPDMGQGHIVDAFMVVVLGGVGQLAGAVIAALGLGVLSKLLEGLMGAVIAKILVLLIIIAFIQKRPQGIFALKGRFADQ